MSQHNQTNAGVCSEEIGAYRNPWHKSNGSQGPKLYETTARPFEHAGCLIYERIKGTVWDVVRDGVCLTQRAGRNGAKEGAEIAQAHDYYPELRT